ncbi:MAG: hypothetical protein RL223_118 [Pseudomonadota bacterium]|jgi:UDP-3-O-[3-hydroxymyristoyl] glucosamine N-acyltransferase
MLTPPRLADIVAALAANVDADTAGALPAEIIGDDALAISRLAPLESAGPQALAFLAQARYASQLTTSQAGAVIVGAALREQAVVWQQAAPGRALLLVADPYRYFARLTRWWAGRVRRAPAIGVHPSAVVGEGVRIASDASIAAGVVIGAGVSIAAGVVIGAHSVIGDDAVIGERTRLAARVGFGDGCRIGARGFIQGGAVIGGDGFGFAPARQGDGMVWEKIEQLGAVTIGDDVEIGANTCVDRGALDDTRIDDGVKLDNLIQVAHNVHIGAHSAMAGCVGIAGSARIGRHCTVGGGAIILGHLELVDHVHVTAATVITRSVLKPGQYSGLFPFDDNASWEKNAATLRQLHTLRERLRALERAARA